MFLERVNNIEPVIGKSQRLPKNGHQNDRNKEDVDLLIERKLLEIREPHQKSDYADAQNNSNSP